MHKRAALLVVDIQPDFCAGGPLAVPGGADIIPLINPLAQKFETVVLTQDWHPADHISFAANHPGRKPFETILLPDGEQVLWPTHCVMDTSGAALHPDLHIPHAILVQRKGSHQHVDSYSAFLEADRTTTTGLEAYLHALDIKHIYICGLATDFCVTWSAEDARRAGFAVTVIEDTCRAIDLNGSLAAAWDKLAQAGVSRTTSSAL